MRFEDWTLRERLAWAAGLFVGEGSSWSTTSATRRQVHANVTQKSLDGKPPQILVWFQRIVGGQVNNYPCRPEEWKWHVDTLVEVRALYDLLYEYLNTVKREQFARSILKYEGWRREGDQAAE